MTTTKVEKCGTCVERKEALAEAGIIDTTEYEDQEMLYPYYIKDNSVQKNFKSQQILSCS